MNIKTMNKSDGPGEIVVWDNKYNTGMDEIDNQHKQLVCLINELYLACLSGEQAIGTAFKDAMSRMVEYVRFHFKTEEDIFKRINYPNYADHVKQHVGLIKTIIEASNDFEKGKRYVANKFVQTLKDWVLGHIAYYDKMYASYLADQKKIGFFQINMPALVSSSG